MNWNSLTGRRDDEAAAPATFYFEWRRRRRAVYAPRRTVSIPLLPTPAPPRGMPKSKSAATPRARPNVLITGTPGTGKTSLAERVAAACGMHHYDVSAVAKREDMCESFDEDLDTHVIDEDKVLDHMEEKLGASDGGIVADYHSCDLFPERWFDLVVVLTCVFFTLVPIRPRWRGERRSLRTFPGVSLRPPLAFNPDTPRRLSTPTDAF